MTETLKRLRELTAMLPLLGPLNYQKMGGGNINYKVDRGSCVGTALLNIPTVAVQMVHLEAGTVFPEHSHEEIEVVILVSGEALHITPGMESKVEKGSAYSSRPGELHKFVALTDCVLVGVTIPASPGYPFSEGDANDGLKIDVMTGKEKSDAARG